MFVLNDDPEIANKEMSALIWYLAAFSHIDGEFDLREVAYIRATIQKVVALHVDRSGHGRDPIRREQLIAHFSASFDKILQAAHQEVHRLLEESVAEAESQQKFVSCRLEQRCFELFSGLRPEIQKQLISTIDELALADGHAHAAELQLRENLLSLLNEPAPVAVTDAPAQRTGRPVTIVVLDSSSHSPTTHDWFDGLEQCWSTKSPTGRARLDADRELIRQASGLLAQQRALGADKLLGRKTVADLATEPSFLDGHVHWLAPESGRQYELTVLGDLHGCYSCLKAALIQSRFFDRLAAYEQEPLSHPEPKLVLLGDYIDRGRFGFEGVFRTALQLFVNAPEHVVLLRGNHEMFVEHEGEIQSVVRPAEAIEGLRAVTAPSDEMLREYMALFDELPSSMLFGRVLFTHGGLPRDAAIKEQLQDLSGLNDPTIRFQMMWSDPSTVDVIPRRLQEATYRFGWGRLQCRDFLGRLGCHTLIRGHDSVDDGFRVEFDDEHILAATLFSAGGAENPDLPEGSRYRSVRPMALTIVADGDLDGAIEITAWPIDYEPYSTPAWNGFLRDPS